MTGTRSEYEVKSLDLSLRAKALAEDLGYGPGGKDGGVIVVVVDPGDGHTLCSHAGGKSGLFDALVFCINEVLKKSAQMLGGDRTLSSVRRWREGKRS